VADKFPEFFPTLGTPVDEGEPDWVAHMSVAKAHRPHILGSGPLDRRTAEIGRRNDLVGIFRNEAVLALLVGARCYRSKTPSRTFSAATGSSKGLQTLADRKPA
jgi:hypothetical protein